MPAPEIDSACKPWDTKAPFTGGLLSTDTVSAVPASRAIATSTVLVGRVLACVRQPLLDDPVDRARGGVRNRVGLVEPEVERDAHPGLAGFLDELRQVLERRLRRLRGAGDLRAAGRTGVAKQADHLAELGERGLRARPDHAGGIGDLIGRGVGVELERAGVHAEEREPVREHVMHLARDPRPFAGTRLLDPLLLLGLKSMPLGSRDQTQADGDEREQHAWRQVRTESRRAAGRRLR